MWNTFSNSTEPTSHIYKISNYSNIIGKFGWGLDWICLFPHNEINENKFSRMVVL